MHNKLLHFFADRYQTIKSQHPGDGRRRLHLRVLQEFWEDVLHGREPSALHESAMPLDDEFDQDDDPLDSLLEGRELGILLRVDYSNEDAWQSFCATLQRAEQELANGLEKPDPTDNNQPASTTADQEEDSDSDTESLNDVPSPIIKIVNPTPSETSLFHNISNLTALRLLNDVDIRLAPSPSQGQSRVKPPNRLIDQGTWQEIYRGMTIWIYDAQSNADHCVRLVSQEGDVYGTATADSWRVQGSHICDLQFNMSFLGMTINFGGLDRWDYRERRRNLEEVNSMT
ncbi:hypothetical protein E4T56_gene1889 [Termitomyces sp. T112]|nr:hypothetical protein E4T56_gene1889 [Termitomyces sp. T112]